MTIFEIVLGILLLIIGVLLCYIIIGSAYYTVFEYIPWKSLPECSELNISQDQFVWNSPRQIPEGINVIKCHSNSFSYEGGGIPLFKFGRFNSLIS